MTRSVLFPLIAALAVACAGDDPKTDTGGGEADADTDADSDADTDADTDSDTAAAACDICNDYGAAVPTVASDITYAAAADPVFGPDFAPLVARGQADIDAFILSLGNFITDAYGCTTGAYTGPDMVTAHTGLGITQGEYDAFIGLIAGVLTDNGVPETDINECFAPPLVDPTFAAQFIGL